ncbi:hypothetical protein [Hymenobacter aerophilus]|uniref:hypothetical protein n=1 Tax=Hymenobacter aerophilus TaxID=119644 RepID=UPI00036075AA|nr:hypothetical protein [Hymenobacter aerophilus]
MRFLPILPLLLSLLLSAPRTQAQQTPAAPDSTARPAASPAVATDVIVLTNGDEVSAQVLRITPELVHYLAPAAPTDTLQLAAAEVFMVRFANGTHEVLRPVPATPATPATSLVGLSTAQRYERGRQDSRKYYQPAKGVFWGTFAGTVAGYGYGGLITGGAIALTPPRRHNLNAPEPELLNDPAYYDGYRRQAQNRKLGKAAAGFGVGTGAILVLTAATFAILLTSLTHI